MVRHWRTPHSIGNVMYREASYNFHMVGTVRCGTCARNGIMALPCMDGPVRSVTMAR